MTDMSAEFLSLNWKTDFFLRSERQKKTGTTINFLPDDTIFEKTKFRAEEVKKQAA